MAFMRKKTPERTRPGSTPQANKSLYAYYNNRSDRSDQLGRKAENDKPAKRQKSRAVRHIPTLILVIAIVASLLYLTTVGQNPRVVVNKDVKNTTLRQAIVYEQEASKFVKGSVLNRSKFTFDTTGLAQQMKTSFPEIATVTVTMPVMGRRPVVYIQTTRPAFILSGQDGSVVVGNNGVALANTHDVQNIDAQNLRTVMDKSGTAIEVGKQALPQEQTAFISTVVEQLEKQNITIDSLTIPQSPYDLQVRVKGKPYYIKFNLLEDPKQQAGSYVALNHYLSQKGITPAEYIDVRVGERVFYK